MLNLDLWWTFELVTRITMKLYCNFVRSFGVMLRAMQRMKIFSVLTCLIWTLIIVFILDGKKIYLKKTCSKIYVSVSRLNIHSTCGMLESNRRELEIKSQKQSFTVFWILLLASNGDISQFQFLRSGSWIQETNLR